MPQSNSSPSFNLSLQKIFSCWWKNLFSLLPLSLIPSLLYNQLTLNFLKESHLALPLKIILGIIAALIAIYFTIALNAKSMGFVYQRPLTYSQSLALGLTRFASFFQVCLFLLVLMLPSLAGSFGLVDKNNMTLILVLTLLAFIAVVLLIYSACALPLVVVENTPAREAIRQSFLLVKNHWWFVVAIYFTVGIFNLSLFIMGSLIQKEAGILIAAILSRPLSTVADIVILTALKPNLLPRNLPATEKI